MIGLVITAKNERALIRSNILYHRYLGVSHFFIFDDGSTDDFTSEIIDLPYVEVRDSISQDYYALHPSLSIAVERYYEYPTARQCLNANYAIERSLKLKLSWLIMLDADELLCPPIEYSQAGGLQRLFDEIQEDVDLVSPVA